jgi:hypothetical protein
METDKFNTFWVTVHGVDELHFVALRLTVGYRTARLEVTKEGRGNDPVSWLTSQSAHPSRWAREGGGNDLVSWFTSRVAFWRRRWRRRRSTRR